jgi:hypothetical protein
MTHAKALQSKRTLNGVPCVHKINNLIKMFSFLLFFGEFNIATFIYMDVGIW